MRYILCSECTDRHLPAGVREIEAASDFEPAEIQRLVVGTARQPQASQRWMSINDDKTQLPMEYYNCDSCNAQIKPGERCSGWSVWQGGMLASAPEPPEWESEYLVV